MADNKNKNAQDAKLIATKEKYEIEYMKETYGVPKKVTTEIVSNVGHSRARVYEQLRKLGYKVPPKRSK